ncbi:lysozyme [Saccharothrix saharensis]|uniref:Lysozyme n=1 Tax=Saccharothrix saharensis TaxID=571190 RepID=A0A543JND0_9PSEU|nr:lysozyme [Saccharothrix saharensis]TQM84284.1 lysozyme [Saccharothrix saharensis]
MPARSHRWLSRTAASAVVLSCLAALHVPVTAAQPSPGSYSDHAAGSQIAKHEQAHPVDASELVLTGPTVPGMDVSSHQGDVDWPHWWNQGMRFAYVKATEGTGYVNPKYGQQYDGSYQVGMVRGAYHFALPDRSDGAAQANYFVDHGGGWSADGRTLPGALDVEYNPYSDDKCYGLTPEAMVAWVRQFAETYQARTGRWPMIYTSTSWWDMCTGRLGDFTATNPLWVARYAESVGTLPHRWSAHSIWQHTSTPIDQNLFNGTMDDLVALARG